MLAKNECRSYQFLYLKHPSNCSDNSNQTVYSRKIPLLKSSQCCYMWTAVLTFCLVMELGLDTMVTAAPQSCVLCDRKDIESKDLTTYEEEYLFEHQVTRKDAIVALKAFNESFYDGTSPESSCRSLTCTKSVMKYCLGPQFINDHCWCELGHTDEGLPFVPHICYVGEKLHTASVGSCFFYEEVKDCCCISALAKQWRHISASSNVRIKASFIGMLLFLLVIV